MSSLNRTWNVNPETGGLFTTKKEGSQKNTLVNISSNQLIGREEYYSVDSSSSNVTLTLDSNYARDGKEVNVKRNGVNSVVVETETDETIDGSTQITLTKDNNSVKFIFNNSTNDWEIY